MVTEEGFRAQMQENGYGNEEFKDFKPNLDGPMHTHEFSVMLQVVSGEFTLELESGATTFGPGEVCQLDAGALHAEKTGPAGAKVLLGRK